MLRLLTLAVVGVLAVSGARAASMRLELSDQMWPDRSPLAIYVDGPIVPGDAKRLASLFAEAGRTGRRMLGVYLNSPGGDLREGIALGEIVTREKATILLTRESVCASACFLALVAGDIKLVSRGARVGIHSAAVGGIETDTAAGGTIAMARLAAQLGAPPDIVGKMVLTPPGGMTWLSEEELTTIRGIRRIYTDLP